jgi:hypothetical protein
MDSQIQPATGHNPQTELAWSSYGNVGNDRALRHDPDHTGQSGTHSWRVGSLPAFRLADSGSYREVPEDLPLGHHIRRVRLVN